MVGRRKEGQCVQQRPTLLDIHQQMSAVNKQPIKRLEVKCALFCITAFMQDEYYVIRLGNQNFEASHSHGYQPMWAFVFQVLPSLPPSPLPLYHYAGR